MAELSEQQIELISAYIKQHGVAQDELHDDLLDHVCTSIENRLQQGASFEEAFQHTIKLFGPGGLKQVQQETFELLTEMNETMKKVTFGFGLTSTFLLLAGTIFKLQHWPGASVMIMLGASMLVLGYLPMILAHKLKESPKGQNLLHITGFLGLALTTVGVLFKVMHWPGAGITLIGGMGILAFGYVPIYFFKRYKVSPNKPITLSSSIVSLACLILIFALMKSGNSSWYEHGIMRINEQITTSASLASSLNSSLYESSTLQNADELKRETDELIEHLESLKFHLIAFAEKVSPDKAAKLNLNDLEGKHNMAVPFDVLIGIEDQPRNGPYSGLELKEKLDAFRSIILQQYPKDLQLQMESVLSFQTDGEFRDAHDQEQDWLHHQFEFVPVFTVLSKLSQWQLEARQMETAVLMYHIGHLKNNFEGENEVF